MAKQQDRLEERAVIVPLSLYPQTREQLAEIQRASGESRSAVVRRLVEQETERLRCIGIERAPVWTFPAYPAVGPRLDARVVFHSYAGDVRVFEAEGNRLRPEPPIGSYVVIGQGDEQLRGQVTGTEITESDGAPTMVVRVSEIVTPLGCGAPPLLLTYALRLDEAVQARSTVTIRFDPNRTTPSWKCGEHEVRALLVGPPGQRARTVRLLPFSGPTFEDHLNPVGDHFPLVPTDDDEAREDAASRIVRFLENGPERPPRADPEATFLRWAETAFMLIQDELGGAAGQTGLTRRFGKADFFCAMDYKPAGDRGIAQFIVQIANGRGRVRRSTRRYDWRSTHAITVAREALADYHELIEE